MWRGPGRAPIRSISERLVSLALRAGRNPLPAAGRRMFTNLVNFLGRMPCGGPGPPCHIARFVPLWQCRFGVTESGENRHSIILQGATVPPCHGHRALLNWCNLGVHQISTAAVNHRSEKAEGERRGVSPPVKRPPPAGSRRAARRGFLQSTRDPDSHNLDEMMPLYPAEAGTAEATIAENGQPAATPSRLACALRVPPCHRATVSDRTQLPHRICVSSLIVARSYRPPGSLLGLKPPTPTSS
jgi:hypothetical protein